ncbi:hypothetical protein MNBD_GAMMA23-714 [hydrothermal vent metagenome]|uniref:Uncharacterized protein n=1 Tax=hydrothermal vent metagenome TaxID=652676 RepID=A0A3B0ZX04_9ZZZZ
METFLTFFDGTLIILAIVLFLATLIVIFFLLSRDSNQRRVAFIERRRNKEQLIFPFYDSDKELVTEERRKPADRRKARAIHVGNVAV